MWYPLFLDDKFYSQNPQVITLWDTIGVSYADFKGIVLQNEGYWVSESNSKWGPVFSKWGLPNRFEIDSQGKRSDGSKATFVNFGPTTNTSKKECLNGIFFGQFNPWAGKGKPAFPCKDSPHGWDFSSSTATKSRTSTSVPPAPKKLKPARDSNLLLSPEFSTECSPSNEEDAANCTDSATKSPVLATGILSDLNESVLTQIEDGRLKLTSEDTSRLHRLLVAIATPVKNVSTVKALELPTSTGRVATWFLPRVPRESRGDEDSLTREAIRQRTNCIQWFATKIGAGKRTIANWIERDKPLFTAAGIKSCVSKVVLSVTQSLRLQSLHHLPHSGLRVSRKELRAVGVGLVFASQSRMREAVVASSVKSVYYSNFSLEESKDSSTNVKCEMPFVHSKYL